MEIGYSLSSEEHSPRALVENAVLAERAGFSFALISDHFHPWIDRQGHSPFVWSVLGGIAATTTTLRVGTGVTCPLIRTHPAVIAQAAATTAALMPGRFFLGVGTGENLNEHILGTRWPPAEERREMLEEAMRLMRLLWEGELCSWHGRHYRLDNARLYTLPDESIEVIVAAGGTEAAELAGRSGDGMVSTAPDAELVEAYRRAGGEGPLYGQVTVCWAQDANDARRTAMEWWPTAALEGSLGQELPLPSHFEEASAMVTEEAIGEAVVCGPDLDAHREAIGRFVDAGFDNVYVHQVGPDQQGFLDVYASDVIPAALDSTAAGR